LGAGKGNDKNKDKEKKPNWNTMFTGWLHIQNKIVIFIYDIFIFLLFIATVKY